MKMNFKKSFAVCATLLCGLTVLANEAHGEAHAGLTPEIIKTVIYQTINLVLLFGGLVYFTKAAIKGFFTSKRASFLAAAEKSKATRAAAEQEHMQIQVRLTKLESTAGESISRARAEAAELKRQIVQEAQALTQRIRDEAASSARQEISRATAILRQQLIRDSMEAAQKDLGQVSAEDQNRLQGAFINNIQAVQR